MLRDQITNCKIDLIFFLHLENWRRGMEKNNNNLLILGIALTVYFLIILILGQSSTAQHNDDDEDSSWLDVRDYYNQFAHFKESNNYNSIFPILYLFFVIIVGIIIIWKVTHRTKERRPFSSEVKRQILKNQNYKCAICKRSNEVWDYDHKNGDRSNNKISNCQALCPNCHAKKTRGLLKNKAKSNLRLLKLFIISLIIITIIYFLY
jgi:hypothetical protein